MTDLARVHSLREAARTAYRNGWMPIPIPYRSKNPNRKNWQHERLTDADIDQRFNDDQLNVGILLGEPSGWLVDVDLDCPEARFLAGHFLAETGVRFGRSSAPCSHWFYIVTEPLTTQKFRDPTTSSTDERSMLLELRSSGCQTLIPPSIHPNGEAVRWDAEAELARVEPAVLLTAGRHLAAASLLARHWPSEGSRHEAALALAGGLLRAGWSVEAIEPFMTAVVIGATDKELSDRLQAIRSSAEAIRSGKHATGWPTLARLTDARFVHRIGEWLGIPSASNSSYEEFRDGSDRRAEQTVRAISVPPFPLAVFPPRIRAYLERGAEAVGCPPDLVAVPFLGYVAAAMGKTRLIRIKARWVQRPILWVGVVARSGDGKSPADSYARAALDDLQGKADERYQEQLAHYQSELAHWKGSDPKSRGDEPAPPLYEHWYSTDSTVEAVAPMLRHTTGLALACDELVAWARSCNAYKRTGPDRQRFLEIWNGRPLKVDRKTQGVIFVKEPVLCIVGGIQPDRLPEMTNEASIHDGLLPRFLWSYPDVPMSEWSWGEGEIDDLEWMVELFAGVRTPVNPLGPLILRPDPEARALWKQWYDDMKASASQLPPLAKEVASKLPAHLARLWLVLETLWRPDDPRGVASADRLADAIELVSYFAAHHRRVLIHFGTTAPDMESGLAGRVRAILGRSALDPTCPGGWLSRTQIWDKLHRNGTAEALSTALATLIAVGIAEMREVPTGTNLRTEWRIREAKSSYEDFAESGEWDDNDAEAAAPNPSDIRSAGRGPAPIQACYACKGTRFYPDGVCMICHPRDWQTGTAP
jgi:hypothetical protein